MTRNCENCGHLIPKQGKWRWDYYATRQFCNLACQHASRPDATRDYIITEGGCWEWQGRLDANGYGKAYDATMPAGQRVDWVHRVSYRHHRGVIPVGYEIDHTCQNTRCINPDHLDAVSKAEHVRRTMQRLGKDIRHERAGALRRLGLTYSEIADVLGYGSKTGAAQAVRTAITKGLVDPEAVPRQPSLSESDRADICDLYAIGVPQTEIAAWYGVDSSHVSRVCSRGATSADALEIDDQWGMYGGLTPNERKQLKRGGAA